MKKIALVLSAVLLTTALMSCSNTAASSSGSVNETSEDSLVSSLSEESSETIESESAVATSTQEKTITKTDVEDASMSLFTDFMMEVYNEIPWGLDADGGTTEMNSSGVGADFKSGTVIVSCVMEEGENIGKKIAVTIEINGENYKISEVTIDSEPQEIPVEFQADFLIWKLLDSNYVE